LPPEPVVESACVEECRWRDATLDVAVLDRKTTPFSLNVTSHAVRSVSPLADWDAPIAAPGLSVPSTHNHVVLADGFPPCVRIFVSALRGNVYCPNYVVNDKGADQSVNQLLPTDDRPQARVKNQKVPRPKSCDPHSSTGGIVVISKVGEIWVEMHGPVTKALRQTQILPAVRLREHTERGSDLMEAADVSGCAFIPSPSGIGT
jgi:hypothetical protein